MDTRSGRIYESREAAYEAGVPQEYVKEVPRTPYTIPGTRIGVNARCPCGSGKKFKRCCNNSRA